MAALTLRLLLGGLFLVSGAAKLFAIDDFELYLFSYGFLSLNFCFIVARLCIGAEFLLGGLLLAGWWSRWVDLAAVLILCAFSVFLCYAALIGRTDSCNCMGRLASMPPSVSLLKNAVLLVLLLVLARLQGSGDGNGGGRFRVWLGAAMCVVAFVVPFVVSVPDNWLYGADDAPYDKELFAQFVEDEHLGEGTQLVAFLTPGCPYCRMSREKLASIQKRNHLDESRMHYYEPDDIGVYMFFKITQGMRPFILLVDNGSVVATYHYRNISERQLTRYLRVSK